jgi:hypothetical protein
MASLRRMHHGCPSQYACSRRLCASPDTELVLLSPVLLLLGAVRLNTLHFG